MTETNNHNDQQPARRKRNVWKWLLLPLILLLIVGGIRWSLQSDRLFDYVRDRVVSEANDRISGTLRIDRMEGDLLFGFRIEGIELTDANGEPLLRLDSARVDYTIPDLWRGLSLNRIRLDGLDVKESQDAEGRWRFESLLPDTLLEEDEREATELPDFSLNRLELNRTSVDLNADWLPDGFLRIRDLALRGGVQHQAEKWQISMGDLRFLLEEGRLPEPLELSASARMDGEEVTLNRLMIGTGRTFLSAHGHTDLDGHWASGLTLSPLSFEDLETYGVNQLQQDLTIRIDAGGSLEEIDLRGSIQAEGLDRLELDGTIRLGERPGLRRLDLEASGLNGPLLTGDEAMPVIDALTLSGEGLIDFTDPELSEWAGHLRFDDLFVADQHLDRARIDFDWINDSIDLDLLLDHRGEQVAVRGTLGQPFGQEPEWHVEFSSDGLNLAELLENPELESSLNLSGSASGTGFEPGEDPYTIELALRESRWGDQPVDRVDVAGRVSRSFIDATVQMGIGEGEGSVDLRLEEWMNEPEYWFSVRFESLNLADLHGFEEIPTHLNLSGNGSGRSFDPDRIQLEADLQLTDSYVNGEPIETFTATLGLDGRILTVPEARIESPIADVNLQLRQNYVDIRDPANWLELEGELKNTAMFAPLLDLEQFDMSGRFQARLDQPDGGESLQLNGNLELSEIGVDSLFTADHLEATVQADLLEIPHIQVGLSVEAPQAAGFGLERLTAELDSEIEGSDFRGGVDITLLQDDDHQIHYGSEYTWADNRLDLLTHHFEVAAGERLLTLQESFRLIVDGGLLQMEQVRLLSAVDQTYLRLEIPHLDEQRQEINLDLQRLHLGPWQQMLLGDSYGEGMLSGHLDIVRDENVLDSDLSLLVEQVRVEEGELDSLRLDLNLADERLRLESGAWTEGEQLMSATGDLPFVPGDPLAFGDEFFDRPVSGEFYMHETILAELKRFIPGAEAIDVDGRVSLNATLAGTAGQPLLEGGFRLEEGQLSGVPIDRFNLDFDYRHEHSLIRLEGGLRSLNSEIARYRMELPLYLDMRLLEIDLPSSDDEVFVRVQTDQFDLALLNDFLDRDQLRDLRGQVSGQFELEGPIERLRPTGNLQLRNGNLRVVPTAVTLAEITSDIQVRPGQLQLQNFQMRSGPGRFTSRGSIELDGLEPGEFDLDLRAVQFRVANSPDMNAIVDLTSRLRGSLEEPVLTGDLRFRSGFVLLQNFGEQAVEDVRLEEEAEREPFEFYENLAMEMNVSFDRQFFIRNRQYLDLEVELTGEVDLVKLRRGDLELFGAMEGVRGYARPLGRYFDLEEAQVVFSGPPENPDLQIRTRFEPRRGDDEVIIWYVISGTVQDPEFRFESEPFLELHDMISYTIFGQPFYALDSWQQAVSGGGSDATASDVAMDLLIDRVGTLAARQLGIDVVQIDTNRSGSSSNTTITTGWFLGERTFFAVLNEIGGSSPKTMFMLEYMLRRNLELVITQGDDSREGIDLRWRFDY